MHCSDIGNPGKPKDLSMNFAARITCEFLAQGAPPEPRLQVWMRCGMQSSKSVSSTTLTCDGPCKLREVLVAALLLTHCC